MILHSMNQFACACARGVGFEPRPCQHASVWDMLNTTGHQTKYVKMGTGSVQINPQPAARTELHWPGDCITITMSYNHCV